MCYYSLPKYSGDDGLTRSGSISTVDELDKKIKELEEELKIATKLAKIRELEEFIEIVRSSKNKTIIY